MKQSVNVQLPPVALNSNIRTILTDRTTFDMIMARLHDIQAQQEILGQGLAKLLQRHLPPQD